MITKNKIEELIKSKAEFLHSIDRYVVESNKFSELAKDIYNSININKDKLFAYKIPIIESEAGWGSKIDDYMICITKDECKLFMKEFNSKNIGKSTPDWYMRCDDEITEIEISESQLNELKKYGRTWLSKLRLL